MSELVVINPGVLQVPKFEPQHVVTLDFECFYDPETGYTLKKLSTSDYVMDPRFEALGCAVKIDDGETTWFEEYEFREWAASWDWSTTAVVAHQAHFDGLICSMHYQFAPAFWFCTLSMARSYGMAGNDLGEVARRFGVGVKNKEELVNAKGKHRKDFTPLEWARFGEYSCNDVDLTLGIFHPMAADFPEVEFWSIDSTVRMFTEPQLVIDDAMLKQYLEEEAIKKTTLLERIGLDKKTIGSNEKLAAAFRQLGVEPPTKISVKTKKEGYAFARTDAGMQELLEHEVEEVRWLAEARIAVKSTQAETRGQRFLRMGAGGRSLPVYLKWFGAHTGRWTASDKTQFQNLQKTDKKDPRKGMLKKSLCARPGRKIVAADSGAIEARGVAWLAEHKDLIESFREKRDVYSEFASIVYGRHVDRKANPEDEKAGFLGKVAVLGLGYQMGFPRLAVTLLAGAMGPPVTLTLADATTMEVDLDKFFGDEGKIKKVQKIISRLPLEELAVHCAVCEKIVQTYRKANAPIKALWKTMEAVLEVMVAVGENETVSFGPNDCLLAARERIIMPSGLSLHYPGLRQRKKGQERFADEDEEDGEEVIDWGSGFSYLTKYGKKRNRIYGGLLTENLIQALARNIINEQMVSLRAKYGYEPVLLTHDEEATVVDESEAALAEYRLVEEMKITPAWAAGWPLNAEGGHAQNYGAA